MGFLQGLLLDFLSERELCRYGRELRAVPEVTCGIDERAEGHALTALGICGLHMHHVAEHHHLLADVLAHLALEVVWR